MRLTQSRIEKSLRAQGGAVALAAKELGVTRQALYRRIAGSPFLQAVLKDILETKLDVAEAVVTGALGNGDVPTARWILERQGRARGYGNKHELTGEAGAAINVNLAVEEMSDEQFALLESLRANAGEEPKPGPRPSARRRNR